MSIPRIVMILASLMVSTSPVEGVDIAIYDFTGKPGDQALMEPTYVHPDFLFFQISRAAGLLTGPDLADSMNSTIDYAQTEDNRNYTWWGTPRVGEPVPAWDFNYVQTGYAISTGSGSLPTQASLQFSMDAGSSWISLGTLNLSGASGDLNFSFPTVTVPYDAPFAAKFKITPIGGSGTDTTFALTNGSFGGLIVGLELATVPEPSTYALGAIGAAMIGLAGSRRRRNA